PASESQGFPASPSGESDSKDSVFGLATSTATGSAPCRRRNKNRPHATGGATITINSDPFGMPAGGPERATSPRPAISDPLHLQAAALLFWVTSRSQPSVSSKAYLGLEMSGVWVIDFPTRSRTRIATFTRMLTIEQSPAFDITQLDRFF